MNLLPPEELEKVTKALWAPTPRSTRFSIKEEKDKFVLDNVQYRGGLYRVEWGKELLDGGKLHTPKYWITQFPERIPDAPLYHATIMALYRNMAETYQQPVEEMKEMFTDDFAIWGLATSTYVIYTTEGDDMVVHGCRSKEEAVIFVEMVDSAGYVEEDGSFEKPLKALLGVTDLGEMISAYMWVTGKEPFLNTLGYKPISTTKCHVTVEPLRGDTLSIEVSSDARTELGPNIQARQVVLQQGFIISEKNTLRQLPEEHE